MTAPEWVELWRFDGPDGTQTANLCRLAGVEREHLILSTNDGGDEGWASLDVAAAEALRDALTLWLGPTGTQHPFEPVTAVGAACGRCLRSPRHPVHGRPS